MGFLTSAWLVLVLLSSTLSEDVTVEIGKDVTLECQAPQNSAVELLAWSRPDLPIDDYVFFYRDNRVAEKKYQAQFYGRVILKDPTMKDGDASVVLKTVTLNDTGTYNCQLIQGDARRRRRNAPDTVNTIKLTVTNPDNNREQHAGEEGSEDGGRSHMMPAVPVIGAVMVVMAMAAMVIGFALFRRKSRYSGVKHEGAGLEPAMMEEDGLADHQ